VRAAVLGRPIGHSLSPVLHTAAYAALGLADWSYTAIDCGEAELPGLVAGLGPDWAGLSLTMPLKRAALAVAGSADPLAPDRAAGALSAGGDADFCVLDTGWTELGRDPSVAAIHSTWIGGSVVT